MKELLPDSDRSFICSVFRKIDFKLLILCAFFLISGQALYISLPSIIGRLVDQFSTGDRNFLTIWLLCFPIAWLVSVILSSFGKFYCSVITQRVRNISKEMIFKHIVSLPSSVYVTRDAGEVESLMQELSFNARFIVNENFPFFIRTFVTLLMSMVLLWIISAGLAAFFVFWLILYVPISYFSAKKSVKDVTNSILNASKVSASTVEVVQNHELIPAFGTEAFEVFRFANLLDNEEQAFNKAQKRIDLCELWQRVLQVVLPLGFVIFLILFQGFLNFTPGAIASVLSLTLILTGQIGDLGKGVLSFLEMRERMKTALTKLAFPPMHTLSEMKQDKVLPAHWDVLFENVHFSYENRNAVDGIDLKIQENEKIGIIGYSGAGKTTFIKLLRGFLVPTQGKITIGDIPLSNIHPKYLAQNIAEVSQNIPLFHRTLRENISYGLPGVSDKEIWKILERAYMAEYVKGLPEGLDTIVGVRGQKLSGGERARIGIARAFIRDAKIIIMDEAMAALDSESEMFIQKGLDELMIGRTIIAIAHRLSTLRAVDRILIMEKGKIVIQGSHQELMRDSDLYKRLWNAQALM